MTAPTKPRQKKLKKKLKKQLNDRGCPEAAALGSRVSLVVVWGLTRTHVSHDSRSHESLLF